MAYTPEGVAIGIGRLHEHWITRGFHRRLDRMVAQSQFVQHRRKVHTWQPGEPLARFVQWHERPCRELWKAAVWRQRPMLHPFGECDQQGTHERAVPQWIARQLHGRLGQWPEWRMRHPG